MSTRSAGPAGGPGTGAPPTSRIVRTSRLAWPALTGLAVLVTVVLGAPRSAWLPHASGPAPPAAWDTHLSPAQDTLTAWQLAVGAAWPNGDAVASAVVVAALLAALASSVLASALARAGLSAVQAALLALVAAAAPLAAWQASSPLGAAPLALASGIVLWWFVSRADHARGHAGGRVSLVLAALLATAEAVVRARQASSLADVLRLLLGDLGLLGVLLLPSWLGPPAPDVPRRPVWLGLTALALLTTPLAPVARAAVLLPWAWWIVGAGLAQLIAWRGARAALWAAAGLSVWIALHAAQIPWEHQRRQAALVRTWAEGVAARVSDAAPLAVEPSARVLLARAQVTTRAAGGGGRLVRTKDVAEATRAGRRPLLLSTGARASLRWQGVALDEVDQGFGVPLERILDALPPGVVTAAAISQDAAAQLSSAQWRALSRIGLRLADAGQPRAHAVVGITGGRAEGLEAANTGSTRLDVLPGDPLGRTGTRAPVDLRLEAGGTRVNVWLRGQPVLEGERGLAVVFFSTRGEFLAWRSGPDPSRIDGPALGGGPRTRSRVLAALPCVDLAPGETRPVEALAAAGALGISVASAGTVDIRLPAPTGATDDARLARGAAPDTRLARQAGSYAVTFASPTSAGLLTRGAATDARATTTVPARICAAWPMLHPLPLDDGRVEMRVSPAVEAHFGQGWHDAEIESGAAQFRWMGGTRADLLFAFRTQGPVVFALDAQGPGAPVTGDAVTLLVNGVDVGVRPLLPTRGIYEWTIDAVRLRPGPNTFTLSTTRTRRPADERAGADPRTLGLLIRGWTFSTP